MHIAKLQTTVLFGSLLIAGLVFHNFLLPGQGPVIEDWETHNSKFTVRVERRADLYSIINYVYVFRSLQKRSLGWHEVARQVHGEPVPLPKTQIRFVGDDVGYLFFQLKYAVTTDGGETWSVFDFGNNSSFKPETLDYSRIADVEIRADGTGEVTMFRYDLTQGQSTLFFTKDYGKHWSLERQVVPGVRL